MKKNKILSKKLDIKRLRFNLKRAIENTAKKLRINTKEREFFLDVQVTPILKLVGALLREIKMDEKNYRWIANTAHQDSQKYYIYTALSEVFKGALAAMRAQEWLFDSEEHQMFEGVDKKLEDGTISGERIEHLLSEGGVEECEQRFRKLQECLCDLICFYETNEQSYYKLFIASQELEDVLYVNRDMETFFDKKMENFRRQSEYFLKNCVELSSKVDRQKCWFLNKDTNFKKKLPLSIMSSYRERYIKALEHANKTEVTVLGPTYKTGYGGSSHYLHFKINAPIKKMDLQDHKHAFSKVMLISFNIIHRIYALLKIEPPKNLGSFLNSVIDSEEAAKGLFQTVVRDIECGDIVYLGHQDIGEVLHVHESKFKYKSYRVKHLINQHLYEDVEEWLSAPYVGTKLLDKKKASELFQKNIKEIFGPKYHHKIDQLSDAEKFNYAKETIIKIAQDGDLELFLQPKNKRTNKVSLPKVPG